MTQPVVSTKTLIKSTLVASIIALIVLVCIILPAEYNIDPTHIGHQLGLTALVPDNNVKPTSAQSELKRKQDIIQVVVPAGTGVEFKFQMKQYEKMTYEWVADGAPLYFDLHGEPEGDTTGYFESYAIATLSEMQGSFTAPFAGSHGWYWENTSLTPVVVQLSVKGKYEVIGLK